MFNFTSAALFVFLSLSLAVFSVNQCVGVSLLRVSHKIFSPNGDSRNDSVEFDLENDADELVTGKILNITGSFVADMTVVDETTLVWQGRDSSGSVVPAGIYVYQIEAQNQKLNGIIVVAR